MTTINSQYLTAPHIPSWYSNSQPVVYNIGDIVFLRTDQEQLERVITAITTRSTGCVYELTCCTTTTWHYDFEFSKEQNILKKL